MPVLITLYFGSLEASALLTADKRVNTISSTVGDLVGQWDPDDGKIDATSTGTLPAILPRRRALLRPTRPPA